MHTDNLLRSIDTVEEFTVFSIERSAEGLDMLIGEARQSGRAVAAGNVGDGLRRLCRPPRIANRLPE